jgi:hypothetical protein
MDRKKTAIRIVITLFELLTLGFVFIFSAFISVMGLNQDEKWYFGDQIESIPIVAFACTLVVCIFILAESKQPPLIGIRKYGVMATLIILMFASILGSGFFDAFFDLEYASLVILSALLLEQTLMLKEKLSSDILKIWLPTGLVTTVLVYLTHNHYIIVRDFLYQEYCTKWNKPFDQCSYSPYESFQEARYIHMFLFVASAYLLAMLILTKTNHPLRKVGITLNAFLSAIGAGFILLAPISYASPYYSAYALIAGVCISLIATQIIASSDQS